jgi:hypothetical protein
MRVFLFFAFAAAASAQEPVVSRWIMSRPVDNAELRKSLPDVHEVSVEADYVEVRSAGLSLLFLGPFQTPLTGEGGVRDLRFRLPRKPVLHKGEAQRIGPGIMGVFLNGVPLYNRFADASYLGRNIWHFDTVAIADPAHPMTLGVLEPMISNGKAHSPLLGFALDGFPIYGPWAFTRPDGTGSIARMHSGYRLRTARDRTHWPDGTLLTPGQYGPPFNGRFPLGTFAEDYEYKPDPSDLDESNGRFSVTPEYPQGTYAYFLTTNSSNLLAFPYFMTDRFRGKLPGVDEQHPKFAHSELKTGKPAELRFAFQGARALEIVHERPLHLMVVSSDLKVFDHIHPQWKPGDTYSVAHVFSKPGKYRLFAQYTLPGQAEQIETFDVEVSGHASRQPAQPAPPLMANLRKPEHIQTGQDVSFTVELTGRPIEPYLGTWGHFVLLDKSRNNFIHAHAADSAAKPIDPSVPHIHGVSDLAAGPPPSSVSFTTNFSQPGHYKLWAQFQVAGNLVVIAFIVDVAGTPSTTPKTPTLPAGAILVTIDSHGFTPSRIEVKSPNPITLAVTRSNTPNCGSQIVFPSLNIKRDLPVGETTLIQLPQLTANVEFACGMGMFRGTIVGVTQP